MSEKRFWINKSRLVNDGWVIDDLKRKFTFPVVVGDKTALYSYCKALNKLFNENEQLKKQKARYKRLSEIRDEKINNRILTIKEFIDNCSNEEVKKALEDLFYSEVNEYDLSKKYRKLHEENEDLKEDNAILRQELTRLVEAFDDKISDKSPVRDLIK